MQPTAGTGPDAAVAVALPEPGQVLRVGLEFLPPDDRFADAEPERVEAHPLRVGAGGNGPDLARGRDADERSSLVPRLTHADFDAIDDPIARETVHFLADLVATDAQRVQREVGIPFFDFRRDDTERGMLLHSEERNQLDHEQWCQQNGIGLLKRPLRQMLKRLPIVHELQVEVDEFRSEQVPLSEDYQQAHGDRRHLGRVSVRLHANDLADPVEVVYIRSGVRIGTSQEHAKLSLDYQLDTFVHLSFRARNDYASGHTRLRADLVYSPSPRLTVHLAAGDDMDFLSTSSIYSLYQSPMDGKAGLVLYAVHTF
ncbi:MAG: hypothetical protein H6835_08530 [Planctomycetes bacterium]|nr:hypothetical protein [Planctomycetota bacterium]